MPPFRKISFSRSLIDHHFRIEQVGRSALLPAQAFRAFAVFYFVRVSHSRPAGNFPNLLMYLHKLTGMSFKIQIPTLIYHGNQITRPTASPIERSTGRVYGYIHPSGL